MKTHGKWYLMWCIQRNNIYCTYSVACRYFSATVNAISDFKNILGMLRSSIKWRGISHADFGHMWTIALSRIDYIPYDMHKGVLGLDIRNYVIKMS